MIPSPHRLALMAALLTAPLALARTPPPADAPTPGDSRPPLSEINKKFDALYRSASSKGRMTMTIVTPNYERSLTMQIFTRGMDDTLMRIEAPRKEKGTATLKKGNEMWNYVPKIKKLVRIPPSMMMGSWMGSDLTNDDVVRASSWEDDYTAQYIDEGAAADEWCVEYVPKPSAAVTWSRVVGCFEKGTFMPRRQIFYDEKKRKARTMSFSEVKEMDGRTFPSVMVLEPHLEEGHRTTIRYDDMDFDAALPPNTFSLNALKRGR